MDLLVRPAAPEDRCAPLLFESAKPYYTAYAGSAKRALKLLEGVYSEPGHAASFECCRVALAGGELVGVVAAFPVADGDQLARRFVHLTFPRLPLWRWPQTFRHLRAAGSVSPSPPVDAYYVDALAVARDWRRQGVAQQLLDDAQIAASRAGLRALALDTGLHNRPARALYEGYGFGEREIRRAPNHKTARALGGPGFVGYLKAV